MRVLQQHSASEGWSVLVQYPPANIPLILGSVLEPDTLGTLLLALQAGLADDTDKVGIVMNGLQTSPRIKLNAAMLDDVHRRLARELWEVSGGQGGWP